MSSKSFVDLLFILLLGTFVMLSRSVEVGAIETAPAEVGVGGTAADDIDSACVVVVHDAGVTLRDGPVVADERAAGGIGADEWVLLVPADAGLSHHRIMEVWSVIRAAGHAVRLGVRSVPAAEGSR